MFQPVIHIGTIWTPDCKRKRDSTKETYWRRRRDLGLTQPEWPKKEINGEDLLLLRPDSPHGETDRHRQGIKYVSFFTYMY